MHTMAWILNVLVSTFCVEVKNHVNNPQTHYEETTVQILYVVEFSARLFIEISYCDCEGYRTYRTRL